MKSRFDVWLDGNNLAEISPMLYILDVQYNPAEYEEESISIGRKNPGSILMYRKPVAASVTVLFELHLYSITQRQQMCQMVTQWANNGLKLTINDRPGQYFRVDYVETPTITSALDWTEALQVTFYSTQPYWLDETETVIETSNTVPTKQVFVPGNTETLVSFESVVNTAASSSSVQYTVAWAKNGSSTIEIDTNNRIRFAPMPASGSTTTVSVSYTDSGLLILSPNTLYANMSGSTPPLLAKGGKVCQFGAQSATMTGMVTSTTFKLRGAWL